MKRLCLFLVIFAVGLFAVASAQPTQGNVDKKAEKAKLVKAEKAYKIAKAKLEKTSPKSTKYDEAKKRAVDATNNFADVTMINGSLSPHEKYAGALHLYREVLKLDPKNAHAAENKKMIEDVYKSMHRPIPPG